MKTLLALLMVAFFGAVPAVAADDRPTAPHRTTAHFRFFGEADVHPILEDLAATAEARFQRMCAPIGACLRVTEPIDIWVAADADAFAAGFPEGNPMSEWAAGVTFLAQQRVILRAHGTAMLTLRETFDHELAHVLAHTYERDGGARLPRWFHEGLAIWLAGEGVMSRLETALRAASSGNLLSYDELQQGFPNRGVRVEIAYAQAALFVKRMVSDQGPLAVIGLLQDAGRGVAFEAAFQTRFSASSAELFTRMDEALERGSSPFMFLSDGNFLWGLMTLLFVGVAWWRLRDRKRQMARLADSEDRRIADEDMALLAERTRASDALELDEDGKPVMH